MRSCVMPGLPAMELNVGTVFMDTAKMQVWYVFSYIIGRPKEDFTIEQMENIWMIAGSI